MPETIESIAQENAEIGGTVLWMGGFDIGPILDKQVNAERARLGAEFAKIASAMAERITELEDKIANLRADIEKLHHREIRDHDVVTQANRLKRKVQTILSAAAIEGDLVTGLDKLANKFHALLLGVNPENEND